MTRLLAHLFLIACSVLFALSAVGVNVMELLK
jgi:hypothetical protein